MAKFKMIPLGSLRYEPSGEVECLAVTCSDLISSSLPESGLQSAALIDELEEGGREL